METPLAIPSAATPRAPSLIRLALPGLLLPSSFMGAGVLAVVLQPLLALLPDDMREASQFPQFALALFFFGGLWARALARHTGPGTRRRMMWAGATSHVTLVILVAVGLAGLEEIFVGQGPSPLPIHQLFTALFVPATALVCAGMSATIGLAAGGLWLAGRLAWRGALAGAVAFLIANVLQDLLGRRVGGPNAAETATMITVMFISNTFAALAMTAAIARALRAARTE